jgi:predicted site-specific integrase-resolvase
MTAKPTAYRPQSICNELEISIATFWRLVKDGKLKTVKISSRCTAVLAEDFESYLNSLK